MEKQIKEIIMVNFKSIFGLEIQNDLIQFQETKKEFLKDAKAGKYEEGTVDYLSRQASDLYSSVFGS